MACRKKCISGKKVSSPSLQQSAIHYAAVYMFFDTNLNNISSLYLNMLFSWFAKVAAGDWGISLSSKPVNTGGQVMVLGIT